ncbi:MAG: hypothetical protein ACI9CD_000556 [Candidatus Deianiraeaceae bacterium]|jgi:hypothetical protein
MQYVSQGEYYVGSNNKVIITEGIQHCSVLTIQFDSGDILLAHIDDLRNVAQLHKESREFVKTRNVSYVSIAQKIALDMQSKKMYLKEGTVGMKKFVMVKCLNML